MLNNRAGMNTKSGSGCKMCSVSKVQETMFETAVPCDSFPSTCFLRFAHVHPSQHGIRFEAGILLLSLCLLLTYLKVLASLIVFRSRAVLAC